MIKQKDTNTVEKHRNAVLNIETSNKNTHCQYHSVQILNVILLHTVSQLTFVLFFNCHLQLQFTFN